MNKNDPRVIKTLKQMDEALLSNLETTPFRNITVSMICKSALINKTTFYKYYLDKFDFLDRYLDRVLQEFKDQLDVKFILAPSDKIDHSIYQEIFLHFSDFMYQRRHEFSILWHAKIDRQLYNEMTDALYDALLNTMRAGDEYSGTRERHLELYAHLFSVHTMALFHWWFENEKEVSAEEVHQVMTGNMKNGFFQELKIISTQNWK